MKNWIINTFFKSHKDAWQRQASMDAFNKAHADIMETMRDDVDKQAEALAKQKLNDLLSVVDLNAVVTLTKQGVIFIGGVRPDDGRLQNLKSEAEFLLNSEIWHILHETPKQLAEKAMFVSGESIDDMKKGRSMLYLLSSQKNILDVFKNYTPKAKVQPLDTLTSTP